MPSSAKATPKAKKKAAATTTTTIVGKQVKEAPRKKAPPKAASSPSSTSKKSKEEDDDNIEEVACCLCHCGMDCSDRALFFPADRQVELKEQEDYYFSLDDPYLPECLYDDQNALVYCDSCERLYHQKCHFVPLFVLPRGDWHCLYCQTVQKCKVVPTELRKLLFQTPPPSPNSTTSSSSIIVQAQQDWEFASRTMKAHQWQAEFQRIAKYCSSQGAKIRTATNALSTFCSTKRNRQTFLSTTRKNYHSQQLGQSLLEWTKAQIKIRHVLRAIEQVRIYPAWWWTTASSSSNKNVLHQWVQDNPDHAWHIFPHGIPTHPRIEPRTPEYVVPVVAKDEDVDDDPPVPHIQVEAQESSATAGKQPTNSKANNTKVPSDNDDDDSGISLDDLICCVCFRGDASDDNDLLLCDGGHCCRAIHMHCVAPPVTDVDEDANVDWFCPLCQASSNLLYQVQSQQPEGEEWERKRALMKSTDSAQSWNDWRDCFPHAEWEYQAAQEFCAKQDTPLTRKLLAMVFGVEIQQEKGERHPVGSDSEDENDYSLFDEESFEERKKRQENDNEDDDDQSTSTRSSQATLVDMSSVEYQIGKDELNALSSGGETSDEDEGDEEPGKAPPSKDGDSTKNGDGIRRSRRLRRKSDDQEDAQSSSSSMGVDFDVKNILPGKRKRKSVDYRKLNDALFGDISEKEKAKLDDMTDYIITTKKTKNGSKKRISRKRKRTTNRSLSSQDSVEEKKSSASVSNSSDDESLSN